MNLSGTWDIIEVPAVLNVYPGNQTETDITFYITIRRKTLFYTVNLILPTVLISFLCVLVFYLPVWLLVSNRLNINIIISTIKEIMFYLGRGGRESNTWNFYSPLIGCVPAPGLKDFTTDVTRIAPHCQVPIIHFYYEYFLHPSHRRHHQLEFPGAKWAFNLG